jgi:hypothetical protein
VGWGTAVAWGTAVIVGAGFGVGVGGTAVGCPAQPASSQTSNVQ